LQREASVRSTRCLSDVSSHGIAIRNVLSSDQGSGFAEGIPEIDVYRFIGFQQ